MITPKQYLTAFCLSAAILLLLFAVGMITFTGMKLPSRKAKSVLPMLLASVLLLTGCTKEVHKPDFTGFAFDKWSYIPENDELYITYNEEGIVCISYKNGDTPQPIIRNCFEDSLTLNILTFIDGDKIYYLSARTRWPARGYRTRAFLPFCSRSP